MESCEKHPHEPGAAICGRCGGAWCTNCLVYAFGTKKPPLCMSCAMFAGGVRSAATRPAMPKKLLKARLKAARSGAPTEAAPAPAAVDEPAPADAPSWETPWWEDDSAASREPTFAD
jgi:hypothetical protein